MQKKSQELTRTALKCIHTTSVCIWVGSGVCVLVLLHHGRLTGTSDELFALNYAIASIDNLLIKPSAAGTFISGILICHQTGWRGLRHRWILAKLLLTLGALVFGALWLAPWLKELAVITGTDGLAVFDDARYQHLHRFGAVAGSLQSALLFVLLLISIVKPSCAPRSTPPAGNDTARPLHEACHRPAAHRIP